MQVSKQNMPLWNFDEFRRWWFARCLHPSTMINLMLQSVIQSSREGFAQMLQYDALIFPGTSAPRTRLTPT